MRVSIIINSPEVEESERLRREVERLRGVGHEVWPRLTFEAGDGRSMAREAVERGAEVVIAAGGDGTVNEVANGVHAAVESGGGVPRLGVVPLGTGNDLATALGIPEEVGEAVEIALHGRVREVDVGMVDGRCFLNVSTGGFGAEATEETAPRVKRILGKLGYVITGARKFVDLRPSRGKFVADEVIHDGSFLLFAVGNSSRTGGGNLLTPLADLSDGLLDLCVVPEMSRVDFMKLLPDLRAGRHVGHSGVIYRQVPRVVVESEEELSVNVDGEPLGGCRRLGYELSPRRLLLTGP